MSMMASRLFTQMFVQAQIKENIKALHHWPLWGEFTSDQRIPRTKGQEHGKCLHLMMSSCSFCNQALRNVLYISQVCKHICLAVLYAFHQHNLRTAVEIHGKFIFQVIIPSDHLSCSKLTHLSTKCICIWNPNNFFIKECLYQDILVKPK